MKIKMRNIGIILTTIIICIDQFSKMSVLKLLGEKQLVVFSFFNLNVVYNKGISFGLMNGIEYGNIIFGIGASLIIIYLIFWFLSSKSKMEAYALSMVIAGAISNVIDRFFYGGVVDFLEFHYHEHFFPSFNIADASIFLGVCILLYFSINCSKTTKQIQEKI
jgi:signal peptidase II